MPVAFVTIKLPDGGLIHLDVELRTRIEEFRAILAPKCGVKKHRQRLVFAGHLLQDGRTLEAYGVERNSTIHLLYAQGGEGEGPGGVDISQMPGQLGALQRHVLANADILQQMLESPAMQSLLNDHDFLRSLLKMDPRLTKAFETDELAQMLADPEFMKQASENLRNPVHVRDVLRSTERSMSQLEGLGGGAFDVLRQMCEDLNKPKEDKDFDPGATKSSKAVAKPTPAVSVVERADGAEDQASDDEAEERQPAALLEPMGPQLPTWAGSFDVNAMASMMQDQNMQHLLAQLVQTLPGPNAKAHPDDPFIDASFLGQMFHAQTITSMTKLEEAIEKLSMTASEPETGKKDGGRGAKKPAAKPAEEVALQDSPGVLSGLHPNSPACNFKESFTLFLQAQAESPEVRYKGQLASMENMGFTNKDACIQALHECDGNMSRAVDILMGKVPNAGGAEQKASKGKRAS
mmetsp:Transcript_88753/g.249986  ORF Transcript_88753/g.249986 Transcript_88753/m.249986 type:complete len:463 (-) Transcript_88753:126-1514(-)|eukprot:CAMPEP_0117475418 /NCGR_PEP_ID=MMETSP0784-20121206/9785_1 /TAXON_ID=39447 /ORGANISM="" /LENGTH=462 /DNA_ID=CAMNT_0005269665 /DNA_START=98 /DNA_END=1486 /DNA_ORIENTATION=-